jgi:tetratricopeptide (TPR) repeat protein
MRVAILILLAVVLLAVNYLIRRGKGKTALSNALRKMRAIEAVTAAYRAGDYATALEKAESLKEGTSATAEYCFFHGTMLHHLGKLVEAESSLREGLSMEENPRQRALVFNTLASVLMDQERFPEAIAFYENAGRTWPDRGANLRGIAEVWLNQGREFPEALEQARQAVEIDRKATGMKKEALDSRLGEDLGVLAWALAANGKPVQEVESTLTEAFHLCGSATKPVLAELHYHAGRAYSALHEVEKSREHFRHAAELDLQGQIGRKARSTISPLNM